MQNPLSDLLLEYYGYPKEKEPELREELNNRLRHICKPCWELKYCPYGPLVEDFPLPPCIKGSFSEIAEYLKKCLELGKYGPNYDMPLDENRRKMFEEDIDQTEELEKGTVEVISDFEKEASCKEFGHLCPAYFVSEPFTETTEARNRSRHIPHSTLIRVVRRDNNTCQVCGKILMDKEIEIDHIIPYSRGGTSDEHNLRVTCLECNRKKGKKTIW